MRILWVTRGGGDDGSDAGDTIYDRRICGALRQAHTFETIGAAKRGRLAQLAHAAARLSAPETFGFDLPETVARIRRAMQTHQPDAIVFSHEHLDRLAGAVRRDLGQTAPAFVTIRHNVTSDAMASFLSDFPPGAALYRAIAQRQERGALASVLFEGVIALSTRDKAILAQAFGRTDAALARPGPPPPLPLAADAIVVRALVLLGTYDWFPKARDLRRFADEIVQASPQGVTVHGDAGVPPALAAQMSMQPSGALDLSAAIRFGVVTDRFTAGHKLKTAAYLMQNCAVLSFADVIDDFCEIPHADRWIYRVRSVDDLAPIMAAMAARRQDEVRSELGVLKSDISEEMAWAKSASVVADAIQRAVNLRRGI